MSFDRKAYFKVYYAKHKAKIKRRSRLWDKKPPDETRRRSRLWAQKQRNDPEFCAKILVASRKWRIKHLKEHYAKHRERILLRKRAWYKANLNYCWEYFRVRAKLLHNAPKEEKAGLVAFYRWVRTAEHIPCAYCRKPTTVKWRHVDHIIPLARGGKHLVCNLTVACPPCNCSKWAYPISEFLARK